MNTLKRMWNNVYRPYFGRVRQTLVVSMQCQGWDGPCSRQDATRTRQNTKYVDEDRNWMDLCPECQADADEYWRDMWSDYYIGCM